MKIRVVKENARKIQFIYTNLRSEILSTRKITEKRLLSILTDRGEYMKHEKAITLSFCLLLRRTVTMIPEWTSSIV